jgi:fibronectin type III domain protein
LIKSIVALANGFTGNQQKGNDMATYHVSLNFAQLPDSDLDEFTGAVIAGLTGNAAFPTPAVSIADLTAAQTAFEDAMTAMSQGGTQATAAKNNARQTLVGLLRQEATYVQLAGKNDLPTLLSSGFQVNDTNTAQSPLDKPSIIGLDNGMTTQLIARVQGVDNARSYEAQVKNGGGWTPAGVFTQTRRMVLTGLTPGQIYSVQVRAVGGSTGYSDWSDPISHMAM